MMPEGMREVDMGRGSGEVGGLDEDKLLA